MRTAAIALVTFGVLAFAGCGGSASPAAPAAVSDRTQSTGVGFGTIVPAAVPASSGDDRLSRCLRGSRDALCFSATSLDVPRLSFDVPTPRETRIGTRATGTNPPDPPTNLSAFISRFGHSSSVFLGWRPATTGPAPADYLIEAGSVSGANDLAAFRTGNTFQFFSTTVSGPGTFYVRVSAVSSSGGISSPSNEVVVTLSDPAVPSSPFLFRPTIIGSQVTLAWSAPNAGDPPTSYVIQASSTAGGPPNLANLATGNASTTFVADGVGPGTYFIRVLAANSAGIGTPSNEVSLIVVGMLPCTAPPGAPSNLAYLVNGSTVTLGWSLSPSPATSYIVEAGSASGLSDRATVDTGSAAGSLVANNVGSGTYYVRVRGKNACGVGTASNEVVITVR